MNNSYPDNPADPVICFICDNGLLIVAVIAIAGTAYFYRDRWITNGTTMPPEPTAIPLTEVPSPMPTAPVVAGSTRPPFSPTLPEPTAALTDAAPPTQTGEAPASTHTPQPQTYIIAFVPVHWNGSLANFESEAQRHAEFFLQKSGLQTHMPVEVKYVGQVFNGVPLNADDLLPSLIAFGLGQEPADRYVGLTNNDLARDGDDGVAGYTFGADYQAVIAESREAEITAHELGHTYGLCDEYSYLYWFEQNEFETCPNPFPSDCPRSQTADVTCPGDPAPGGLNSIMGPAGMSGGYAYNTASYNHLQTVFAALTTTATAGPP